MADDPSDPVNGRTVILPTLMSRVCTVEIQRLVHRPSDAVQLHIQVGRHQPLHDAPLLNRVKFQ